MRVDGEDAWGDPGSTHDTIYKNTYLRPDTRARPGHVMRFTPNHTAHERRPRPQAAIVVAVLEGKWWLGAEDFLEERDLSRKGAAHIDRRGARSS